MAFELELISPFEVAKDVALAVQEYTLLSAQSLANFFRRPLYMGDMVQQADLIGVGSLPIVILTGLSVGALLALNSASTLQRFGGVTLIGQLVSLGLDTQQYWTSVWQILVFRDVFTGLIKPVLFGFIISTVGCYYGISTRGGTQGVGRSTTQAVVASSVLILIVDFFVTKLIFAIFGYR